MDERDVDVVEREAAYQGHFRIDRYRLRHRLHEGGMGPEIRREVLERGEAAAVLPVDPDRDRVVLIEQFRIGAYAAGMAPWLLEVVAGIREPGEDVEALVRREALEEAGCEIGALRRVGSFLTSPGACSERLTLFCGRVDSTGVGGVHGLDEEGEDILVHVLGVEEAIGLLRDGRIVNAKTVIALQWLAMEYDALRREWRANP